MKNYVEGKVVVITGGSSGFGLETARLVLELGGEVVITGRNAERLEEAKADLGSERLVTVQADATITADWKRLVETTVEKFGRIDVLVNNHGAVIQVDAVENMTDETIQEVCDLNLNSVIKGCREVIPVMKKQGSGHIINISSSCAHHGWAMWGPYTAAKTGIVGFTHVLHREMCEWGGKATCFTPGAARTNFCQASGIDSGWMDGYPTPADFARTLVHCIDMPDDCVIEEVRIWGTKQIKDMLNPY